VWVSEWGLDRIGRFDVDGHLDQVELPGERPEPHGIAIAPDGRVWTALESGRLIAITPP
jgi:virginiamycin B lyase